MKNMFFNQPVIDDLFRKRIAMMAVTRNKFFREENWIGVKSSSVNRVIPAAKFFFEHIKRIEFPLERNASVLRVKIDNFPKKIFAGILYREPKLF